MTTSVRTKLIEAPEQRLRRCGCRRIMSDAIADGAAVGLGRIARFLTVSS